MFLKELASQLAVPTLHLRQPGGVGIMLVCAMLKACRIESSFAFRRKAKRRL